MWLFARTGEILASFLNNAPIFQWVTSTESLLRSLRPIVCLQLTCMLSAKNRGFLQVVLSFRTKFWEPKWRDKGMTFISGCSDRGFEVLASRISSFDCPYGSYDKGSKSWLHDCRRRILSDNYALSRNLLYGMRLTLWYHTLVKIDGKTFELSLYHKLPRFFCSF